MSFGIIIIFVVIKPLFDKKGQTKVLYKTCGVPQNFKIMVITSHFQKLKNGIL